MWSVILLLGLAIIMLIRMIVKSSKPIPVPEPEPILVDASVGMGIEYIADEETDIIDVPEHEDEDIDMPKKPTGLEQIEKFIDKDPAAVAQLLRNWITEE
jgi:flagellar M-ring protein FliF